MVLMMEEWSRQIVTATTASIRHEVEICHRASRAAATHTFNCQRPHASVMSQQPKSAQIIISAMFVAANRH